MAIYYKLALHIVFTIGLLISSRSVAQGSSFMRPCRYIFANYKNQKDVALRVIELAEANREHLMKRPLGELWLEYLEGIKRNVSNSKPARPVPVKGVIRQSMSWMVEELSKFEQELNGMPSTANQHYVNQMKSIIPVIKREIEKYLNSKSIGRARMVHHVESFLTVSDTMGYLRSNDTSKGDTYPFWSVESFFRFNEAQIEANLDRGLGMTALPLYINNVIGFRSFIQTEGTGVILKGLRSVGVRVHGRFLTPTRFTTHDAEHEVRRYQINSLKVARFILRHHDIWYGNVDKVLFASLSDASPFITKLLSHIDKSNSKRQKQLSEAIAFYLMRETASWDASLNANLFNFRSKLRFIHYGRLVKNEAFSRLSRSLKDPEGLGVVFKNPPSEKEIVDAVEYLMSLP